MRRVNAPAVWAMLPLAAVKASVWCSMSASMDDYIPTWPGRWTLRIFDVSNSQHVRRPGHDGRLSGLCLVHRLRMRSPDWTPAELPEPANYEP